MSRRAAASDSRYRLRVTWGWGRKDEPVAWNAQARVVGGRDHGRRDLLLRPGDRRTAGRRRTHGFVGRRGSAARSRRANGAVGRLAIDDNRQPLHASRHDASDLARNRCSNRRGVDDSKSTARRLVYSLGELLGRGRSAYLRGWLSEAIRVGPLVPVAQCEILAELDDEPESACDRYRLRVAQTNGQWAWLSPIWVER